jgi:hypothetical protein
LGIRHKRYCIRPTPSPSLSQLFASRHDTHGTQCASSRLRKKKKFLKIINLIIISPIVVVVVCRFLIFLNSRLDLKQKSEKSPSVVETATRLFQGKKKLYIEEKSENLDDINWDSTSAAVCVCAKIKNKLNNYEVG